MEKDQLKPPCELLVIGGSAGSLDVLMKILPELSIPAFAIAIIVHRKSAEDTNLEELIAAKTIVPVVEVEDKTPVIPGHIYVAPSDYHLLFEKDQFLSLDTSEKVNYSRPSIDVSFESAAEVYGKNLVAILLSGANADGTEGLKVVKNAGGVVVIQNPETATMPFMPQNALMAVEPDFLLDVKDMLSFISSL